MRRIYCVVFAIFLSFSSIINVGWAKTKTSPEVPITQIDFTGGKLVQENWSQGLWVEYDFRGTRRYEFVKTTFDDDVLTLQGTKGNVILIVNIPAKTISGEWPGHPMRKLYEITRVTYLSSTKQPQLEEIVPNTVPPGKKPPIEIPPKKEETLSTDALSIARYEGGSFYKVDKTEWREENKEGTIFRFEAIGSDDHSVFLYDKGREILIELDVNDKMARISHSGEKLQNLYPLTEFVSNDRTVISLPSPEPPLTPIPNRNGKMNTSEKADCITKGGFIERAGMLGFERCTFRYSDGGNICIDSSNCEGKCLATVEDAQNKAVSGQCQATDNPFGCYAEVIAGSTGPALCVD